MAHLENKNSTSFEFKAVLSDAEMDDITVYLKKIYPERQHVEKDFDFFVSHPNKPFVLARTISDTDGHIKGVNLFLPLTYWWEGRESTSSWGFDMEIDPELRREAWGLDFMLWMKEQNPISHCTGPNELATKLIKGMGNLILATIRKYVGVVNWHWLPTSLLRCEVPTSRYPKQVKGFERIDNPDELPDQTGVDASEPWQASRSKEWLRWRYFSGYKPYALYLNRKSGSWFVVRTFKVHGVTALALIDWRCPMNPPQPFEQILKAVKKTAARLHLAIVATGSTHATSDAALESHRFKSVGRPRPFMGPKKLYKNYKEAIEARTFALVTLADSDGDFQL